MAINYPGNKYYLNLSAPFMDDNVRLIQARLCELGFLSSNDVDGYFGVSTEKAVKKFQSSNGAANTGIVDKSTWELLFKDSNTQIEEVETNTPQETEGSTNSENNKQSFFNKGNNQLLRKNNQDIVITYGDNHMVKTIQNVIFRSKTQVINAGGQPIAETYEFIGQDLIESEEG